jgi:SAM-dependent methyltransferase
VPTRYLPAPLVRRLRRAYQRVAFPNGYFRSITLSEREIDTHAYESYLYGSREAWRGHGAFQLFFLQAMGLRPSHTLLDIGCGPLRGGMHAIAYLDRGHYCGIDCNESFIRAARARVHCEGLSSKEPVLHVIDDFDLEHVVGRFDFGLAFSVLNHCTPEQRRRFLLRVPERLNVDARLYVSHADWFRHDALTGTRLVLNRLFARAPDVSPTLRMPDWAWPEKRPPVFPMLELQIAP